MFRVALIVLALWADDPTTRAARERFAAGKRAFEAAEYESAVREFKAARDIRPSPILEYNIGLAYERLGRLDLAVEGYQAYLLGDPKATNRADVEARITMLKARIASEGSYAPSPPFPRADAGAAPPAPPGPAAGMPPAAPGPEILPPSEAAPSGATPPSPPSTTPPFPAAAGTPPSGGPAEVPAAPPGPTTSPPAGAPPRVERYRLTVDLRFGGNTFGSLGAHARNDTLKVEPVGNILGVGLHAPLPAENLEFGADGVVGGNNVGPQRGGFGFLTIRAKLGYVHRSTTNPGLEVAFYGGLDWNSFTFKLEDNGMTRSVAFAQWGANAEFDLRYVLRMGALRPEIVLALPVLHVLPALPSSGKQVYNPATENMEPAAIVLDLDHRSVGASVELGIGLRF